MDVVAVNHLGNVVVCLIVLTVRAIIAIFLLVALLKVIVTVVREMAAARRRCLLHREEAPVANMGPTNEPAGGEAPPNDSDAGVAVSSLGGVGGVVVENRRRIVRKRARR